MLRCSNGLVSRISHRRLVSDTPCPIRLCGSPSQLVPRTNQTLYPQLIDRFTSPASLRQRLSTAPPKPHTEIDATA